MTAPVVDLSVAESPPVVVVECTCPEDGYVLHTEECLVQVLELLAELAELQQLDRDAGAHSCRVCGCTEAFACLGGCAWATRDVCTSCGDAA